MGTHRVNRHYSSIPGLGFVVLALLAAAVSAPAQTRPLLTEEATTAPGGTLVLEVGGAAIGAEPNFLTEEPRTRWQGPVMRLTYSPADTVEVDLEWTARVGARSDPDFGDVSDFGDVALRTKIRFLDAGNRRPGLGFRFGMTLPQTSFGDGLGPNTIRMAAELLATQHLGSRATLHANAGLAIHDEPLRAHEQRDFLAYGVALEVQAHETVTAVAEVSGLAGKGSPGADERSEARLGVRLGRGRLVCDAALRRGLTTATGDWGFSVGLRWTLRTGDRGAPAEAGRDH